MNITKVRPAASSHGATAALLLSDSRDISAFEPDWERLFAHPGNEPSSSYEWNRAMLRHHLSDSDRPFLLGLKRDSELIGLALLVARRTKALGLPVRVLSPINDAYNTHGHVLSNALDGPAVQALFAALFELPVAWDVFRISNVLEGHPLLRHFDETVPRRWPPSLLRGGHASYYLELPSSYEEYLRSRSSAFRNHLKRTERRLHAQTDVVVREYWTPDDIDEGYAMLLDVERASWKNSHGTAITSIPRQEGFYRDLCRGAAAHRRIHLQVLLVDGQPAAYNLGYVRETTYSYLKTSFAESLKPLGVATYLRAALVRTLIERGLRVLDFPAAPYDWERQWTDTVRWHKTLTLYRPTVTGLPLWLADRARTTAGGTRMVRHVDPRAAG